MSSGPVIKIQRTQRKVKLFLALLMVFAFKSEAQSLAPFSCDIPDVKMDHYLVTRSEEYPKLVSTGVATCILLILHDPISGVAAMGHFSASVDSETAITEVLRKMEARGASTARISARLYGGWKGFSERSLAGLESALTKRRVPIEAREVLSDIGMNLRQYVDNTVQMRASNCSTCSQDGIRNIYLNTKSGRVAPVNPIDCPPSSIARSGPKQDRLPLRSGGGNI